MRIVGRSVAGGGDEGGWINCRWRRQPPSVPEACACGVHGRRLGDAWKTLGRHGRSLVGAWKALGRDGTWKPRGRHTPAAAGRSPSRHRSSPRCASAAAATAAAAATRPDCCARPPRSVSAALSHRRRLHRRAADAGFAPTPAGNTMAAGRAAAAAVLLLLRLLRRRDLHLARCRARLDVIYAAAQPRHILLQAVAEAGKKGKAKAPRELGPFPGGRCWCFAREGGGVEWVRAERMLCLFREECGRRRAGKTGEAGGGIRQRMCLYAAPFPTVRLACQCHAPLPFLSAIIAKCMRSSFLRGALSRSPCFSST
eukprot:174844-Chlamydomonas_euryale.AAC.1